MTCPSGLPVCHLDKPKVCYPTRNAARSAAKQVRHRRNRPGHDQALRVYLCWRCGAYHYGHRPLGRRSAYSGGYFPPGLWEIEP